MTEEIIKLLVQLPVLAIFVWWVAKSNARWDENNKEWRSYLSERNGQLEKTLEKMATAIDRFHERMDNLK